MHVLATTCSLIYLATVWHFSKHEKPSLFKFIAHFFAVILATPPLWQAFLNGYPQDSFFTLNTVGKLGVITISLILISGFYSILFIKSRLLTKIFQKNYGLFITASILDSIISLAIFYLLFSLSPQIYYSFYQIIIPDLPNQIVIKSIFNIDKLATLILINRDGTLSNHLSSLSFLAISPFTFWIYYHARTSLFFVFISLALLSMWLPLAFY